MVPSLALAQDAQTAPAAIPANDSATPPATVPASDATVAANAAPVIIKYTVRIDAPGDLKQLLEDNLDLERFRDSPRMTREQLFRLVRTAPEQIRTLVSTSGYYTPEVSVTFDRAATPARLSTPRTASGSWTPRSTPLRTRPRER